MHTWHSPSLIKSSKFWNVKKVMANRPKGLTNEEWNEIVKNEKLDKKIVLDCVPKPSAKKVAQNEE